MADRLSISIALSLLHLLIAVFCLWNISSVSERAGVPFRSAGIDGQTVVTRISDERRAGDLQAGDRLVFWKIVRIAMPEHIELLAELSKIGDSVRIQVEREGELMMRTVELVPFYHSYRFAVVTAVAGMTILLFALFVYFKRPGDPVALMLHWSLVSLATVTMMTQGSIESGNVLSELRRIMLFVSYNMTAACFFLFATRFPRQVFTRPSRVTTLVLSGYGLLAGALSWYHIKAMRTGDPEMFRSFQQLYDIFHVLFLLALVAGLALIFLGYVRESFPERRKALRWIFYGILIGATPFLVLVVMPQLWGPDLLAPEELAIFFTLAIPVSLTVAFLRYHVFSIEIQHRQRLTTFLLRTASSLLQVLFAMIVLSTFWEDVLFGSHVLETLTFGLFIVLLAPLHSRLLRTIEEAVFPARFNPTRLLHDASSRFKGLLVPADVGPSLVSELHRILPRFMFLWYRWNGRSMLGRSSSDPSFMPTLTLSPVVADDISEGVVVSSPEGLRLPADTADPNHEHWLREHGMSIAVPLRDDTGTVHGLLCARRNAGADILDRGEFELVRSFCFQATAVLQHLHLQEQMMFEQRKRREVQELNRLKSHFVASVSHDLRTPLTSIGMFLELLEQQNVPVKKRVEYIEFIRQEAVRLRQLVNNVLDFARAERGMQEFTSAPTNLGVVLRGAAEAMKGQCTATRTHYIVRIPGSLPQIQADGQALERAFVNLLSNAHKYTPAKKRISFTARRDGDRVLVKVADNGFGIPKKDLNRIFDPFFRVRDLNTTPTGGVGLGLSLVKRTIEHHGGTISVHSRQGKGTTVTVSLPIDRPPA